MGSTGGWRMEGMEVPMLSNDSIEWVRVSVPSSSDANYNPDASQNPFAKDFASCRSIGDSYFIWKTHKNQSNVLEILELRGHKETSKIGLQLIFPDALFPFAFICKDENKFASGNRLLLYTLTISGVAYLIRLRNNFDYETSSLIPTDDILEYNTQIHTNYGTITAVAATAGSLVIGRSDGSVGYFQLGLLDPSAPGFVSELREDSGFGRLWGILSRSATSARVQDLVLSEMHQRKLLFVLHSDGSFRVWDLSSRAKILSHTMTVPTSTDELLRLWVGEASNDTSVIPLAILHKENLADSVEKIFLYSIRCTVGDRITLLLEPSLKKISLAKGGPIDVKITSKQLWVLQEGGLVMHNLFGDDVKEELAHYYLSQETIVSDLLFQSSEHSSDDLLWLAYSAFSSAKEEIAPFVSSIFVRGLLFLGVHYSAVLRQTLADYNKHFTDSEFGSFTVDGLKNEILSLIEHQGGCESPVSTLRCWNTFCTRYVNNWCKSNAVFGLLSDPYTGAIGLVRNSTISLFRGLEDAEHILYDYFNEHNNPTVSESSSSGSDLDRPILLELLKCVDNVSHQLGKASSAIFYESLLTTPNVSSEDLIPRFLKVLETGHIPSISSIQVSELGADTAWEKELSNHRNLRKFSTEMFLSLQEMCNKAESWGKVMDVMESFLKFLVPHKVATNNGDPRAVFGMNSYAVVGAMSQISKVMFDSALDFLMLLSYMVSISGQINMSHADVSRVKLELIPMIQELITEWHIIHFLGTTPSESPTMEDFSSQLSSLQIDNNVDRSLQKGRLGKCDFSLASILLLSMQSSSEDHEHPFSGRFPNPGSLVNLTREFTSWIIWGRTGEESSVFFSHSIDLAIVLVMHRQYNAAEYLLSLVDIYSRKEKIFESLQSMGGKFSTLFHLLGCCLVAQTQHGLLGTLKDVKSSEALRCFFRAASLEGASTALQSLPREAGWLRIDFSNSTSSASWKLHYYDWVMQLFERFSMNDSAIQFALAALEQVDEALRPIEEKESVTTVKGRFWANVFKFNLDLNNYNDAYCAIISNPDEESKNLCLRWFINVLYERGDIKILCDGQLPLIGLVEKVERELARKAEYSDPSIKPNPFQLLYAFEMHRHNWRKAARYIYLYTLRLRGEAAVKDYGPRPNMLQERLNGLSAAINALQLVHQSHAWIEVPVEENYIDKESYPNKKARMIMQEQAPTGDTLPIKSQSYIDVEKLDYEFVLTSAEYVLSLANIKWTSTGNEKPSSDLIHLLVESNSYDMAFTVILKFWKGSGMKRELERVFIAMAFKCCPNKQVLSPHVKDRKTHGLLLTSSQYEVHGSLEAAKGVHNSTSSSQWQTLEYYLDKYRAFHQSLPLIVAGTLLSADPQIELPLWLVRVFKVRNENNYGMSGNESNPASLFGLYVDYGRYAEAVNLLKEYTDALASLRPADVIRRKKPFAIWFPYTSIERLWCLLEESIKLGHRIDHCEKLKKLLHGFLLNHLNLLKVDSEDVQSCAF